jgi:hypothetical protein
MPISRSHVSFLSTIRSPAKKIIFFAFSFKHIILRETINFIEYTAVKNEEKKKEEKRN